jgi:hypothetical protein
LMRLAAKMRPSKRSPRSLPIASRQLSAVKPSRSKIPASSAEIEAFPCRKSRPVHSTSLIGHGNRLAKFVSRRKQPSPTLNDLEIGPPLSNFGIKPQEHMQVIVHNREPTDGHGEDFRKGGRLCSACLFLPCLFLPKSCFRVQGVREFGYGIPQELSQCFPLSRAASCSVA